MLLKQLILDGVKDRKYVYHTLNSSVTITNMGVEPKNRAWFVEKIKEYEDIIKEMDSIVKCYKAFNGEQI